jgi:RimJ/RimL family protein N-acetyltransferase
MTNLEQQVYSVEELQKKDFDKYSDFFRTQILASPDYTNEEKNLFISKRDIPGLESLIIEQGVKIFILKDLNGSIVGCVEGRKLDENGFGYISWIITDSNLFGRGLSKRLHKEIEKYYRLINAKGILASIKDTNNPSIQAHLKFGFEIKQPLDKPKVDTTLYVRNF